MSYHLQWQLSNYEAAISGPTELPAESYQGAADGPIIWRIILHSGNYDYWLVGWIVVAAVSKAGAPAALFSCTE